MIVLAIDTAGAASTVALADGDTVLWADHAPLTHGHGQVAPVQVETALSATGLSARAIDRFGATVGPGSFTGVRVGLALAQGLARGADRPMVGVTRFALFAQALAAPVAADTVMVCLDSRRDAVFAQSFSRKGGGWSPASDPEIKTAQAVAAQMAGQSGWVVTGDVRDRLLAAGLDPAVWVSIAPTPEALVRCVATTAAPVPGHRPAPLYLSAPSVTPPAISAG